jgi:hypothetical protein
MTLLHQVQQFLMQIVMVPLSERWKAGYCDIKSPRGNDAVVAERAVGGATGQLRLIWLREVGRKATKIAVEALDEFKATIVKGS